MPKNKIMPSRQKALHSYTLEKIQESQNTHTQMKKKNEPSPPKKKKEII